MTSERWFRRLLRLLPLDFRADYGDEMARTFHAQQRDASGTTGALRVWLDNLAALLAIGPREHAAQLAQDVRYALRGMRRNLALVAAAILTLALGIGANAAVFSVVDAVLLRPLPYSDPARLVAVWNRWDGSPAASLSNPEYLDYADASRSMMIAASAATNVNIGGQGGDPERVVAALVTANAYDVLGVPPRLGRAFRSEEEAGGLVIKTERDPSATVAPLRATLRALDPDVPAAHVRDMSTILAASVADRRLNVLLIGAFGVLALALAAIGLYGVMAYTVSQRTREVGVRIALGATRGAVLSLVVGHALGLVAAGVAIGLGLSLVVTGSLARLLFDVGPRDVTIYAVAPAILLLTAVAASYLPARRATRIDPVIALRTE